MDNNVSSKWVPVKEELPKDGYPVWVTAIPMQLAGDEDEDCERVCTYAACEFDRQTGERVWRYLEGGTSFYRSVIAWMTAPEPYIGDI